ncbi:MAG: dipeptide epimerase [Actinomycetota bacterium]|nr:dipeptide epimerase [Actinomycetota bacterium]
MENRKFVVHAAAVELELAERFTIARASWDSALNVFVTLSYGSVVGRGEVSPDERWGESAESVVRDIHTVPLDRLAGPFDIEGLSELLPAGGARSALDIAMHDLAAKLAGVSVAELLGLGGREPPATSVTVPIAAPDEMVERARGLADHPSLKMKVGFDGDVDVVAAIRGFYDGTLRIDANEGWDTDTACARLLDLEPYAIELCEQPIPAGRPVELRRVTESSPILIFADEDVCTARDVADLVGVVDGVNLKLRKTGGLREFVRAVNVARAHDMKVMIGCDLESGIAATAQASVASVTDYADLDGPLLLKSDPYPGVGYDRGVMTLPPGPGLGVREPAA